jgi:hypothetical protein
LFSLASTAGRRIMSVCEMGFACEVKARLKDEPADLYIIDQVLTVVNVGKPTGR